jgi:hypothetical protein
MCEIRDLCAQIIVATSNLAYLHNRLSCDERAVQSPRLRGRELGHHVANKRVRLVKNMERGGIESKRENMGCGGGGSD